MADLRLVCLFAGASKGLVFEGERYVRPEDPTKWADKTLYILHAAPKKHYLAVTNVQGFYRAFKSNAHSWCHGCCTLYSHHVGHQCEVEGEPVVAGRIKTKCHTCRGTLKPGGEHECKVCEDCQIVVKGTKQHHHCRHIWCRSCGTFRPEENDLSSMHRHPVIRLTGKPFIKSFVGEPVRSKYRELMKIVRDQAGKEAEDSDEEEEGGEETQEPVGEDDDACNGINCWAYDIEAAMRYEYTHHLTENGSRLVRVAADPAIIHTPNLLIAKHLFIEGEEGVRTASTVEEFIQLFLADGKKHYLFAHNASGYDSRFIFQTMVKLNKRPRRDPLFRGNKILLMGYDNLRFADSMCHLQGSLAGLGKEFGLGPHLLKGHFPHAFNRVEHAGYCGPMPQRHEYVDVRFLKTQEQRDELEKWYDEQVEDEKAFYGDRYEERWLPRESAGDPLVPNPDIQAHYWSLDAQLKKYCTQDVEVLARILRSYHDELAGLTGFSPLNYATSAGFVHNLFLQKYLTPRLRQVMNYLPGGVPCCTGDSAKEKLCKSWVAGETWTELWPGEYYFARDALRGGRTDVRSVFFSLSDEQKARGETIKYIDVVSMYPYVQTDPKLLYPVGPPRITIYYNDPVNVLMTEDEMIEAQVKAAEHRGIADGLRKLFPLRGLEVAQTQPSLTYLKTFFGFIMADLTPPKRLFHPVLVRREGEKCLASLTPIVNTGYKYGERYVFTSVEFQKALEYGYRVDAVYCIHVYLAKQTLWGDLMKDVVGLKIANSGLPEGVSEEEYREEYRKRFDMELPSGEIVLNKAKKATYKRPANSAWGKCAETPDHDQVTIVDGLKDVLALEEREVAGRIDVSMCRALGESNLCFYRFKENRDRVRPKLEDKYIAAAVFVPMYGRMVLWEVMNRLGKRVLMHDTDSIIYHHVPGEEGLVPRSGPYLGDWELDGIHTKEKGEIGEFLGHGPKSYGLKYVLPDGTVKTVIKTKGVSIKLDTAATFAYEDMKALILDPDVTQKLVPQTNFTWNPTVNNGEVRTWHHDKVVRKNECLKGELHGYTLYPYGYVLDVEEELQAAMDMTPSPMGSPGERVHPRSPSPDSGPNVRIRLDLELGDDELDYGEGDDDLVF